MLYTSYFAAVRRLPANVVPVSISLWPPKGWAGARYTALAPTKDILTSFKANGDWDAYVRRYKDEVLARLDPHAVVAQLTRLSGGRPVALCCFENISKPGAVCHRTLVAEWLRGAGYEVEEYRG